MYHYMSFSLSSCSLWLLLTWRQYDESLLAAPLLNNLYPNHQSSGSWTNICASLAYRPSNGPSTTCKHIPIQGVLHQQILWNNFYKLLSQMSKVVLAFSSLKHRNQTFDWMVTWIQNNLLSCRKIDLGVDAIANIFKKQPVNPSSNSELWNSSGHSLTAIVICFNHQTLNKPFGVFYPFGDKWKHQSPLQNSGNSNMTSY